MIDYDDASQQMETEFRALVKEVRLNHDIGGSADQSQNVMSVFHQQLVVSICKAKIICCFHTSLPFEIS